MYNKVSPPLAIVSVYMANSISKNMIRLKLVVVGKEKAYSKYR
jgi:hypothetical protein